MSMNRLLLPCLLLLLCVGCGGSEPAETEPASATPAAEPAAPPVRWAIAIHGGALSVVRPDLEQQDYRAALETALRTGTVILERGGTSLDAVEQVIRVLEDDAKFNAGKGAVFTSAGTNELDASIMDGRTLACGAVTGVTTVKNPISLARRVMEDSRHVFFAGQGAEAFARQQGLRIVDPRYFFTQDRWEALQKQLQQDGAEPVAAGDKQGTVGCVALDRHGNLAAGTSTGGLTNKRFGRIGDSPVIGAGTYASNRSCAISGTGKGEEFIRNAVAHDIAALMEYKQLTLQRAAEEVVLRKLRPGDGGVIGVARDGSIAMVFNTQGLFRGAADSTGRLEVLIGKD